MRDIVLEFPIFQTQNGLKKYYEILTPCIDEYDKFKLPENAKDYQFKNLLYEEFYMMLSKLSVKSKDIVNYNDCKQWIQLIWNDFPSKFNIIDLLDFISSSFKVNGKSFLSIKRTINYY